MAGDDHGRHYGEEVYLDFRRFHDSRYGAFSELTFKNSSMEHFISLWRGTAETRSSDPVWSALAQLPQVAQESIAAGCENLGRRPAD
jgi:hypothetical protein